MNASTLLDDLQHRGITLWLEQDRIRFRAPCGALTTADRQAIDQHRQALISLLRHDPAIPDASAELTLSALQQAYLTGARPGLPLGGQDAVYCMELQQTMLEPERLQQSLQLMLQGHPALRMKLEAQQCLRVCELTAVSPLTYHDIRHMDDARAALLALREQLLAHRRDYQCESLFDVMLVRLADQDWRLLLRIDLLALDAWSGYLFIQQWLGIYAGQAEALTFPRLSAMDIQLEEIRLRQQPRWQQAKDWWLAQIDSLPAPPALPVNAQVSQLSIKVQRISGQLAANDWRRVKELAQRRGITHSALLLAIFVEALNIWSQRPAEMLLNITLFQRAGHHPERHRVLGDFTNIMVLPCPARQQHETLFVYARRIQNRLWQYLEYSVYDGVGVLRQLSEKSPRHRILAAPVVFTSLLFDMENQRFHLTPAGWRQTWAISRTPQVALDFQLYEDQQQLILNFDYAVELFKQQMIQAVMDKYLCCLSALSENNADSVTQYFLFDEQMCCGNFRLGDIAQQENLLVPAEGNLPAAAHQVAACWSELLGYVVTVNHTAGFMESGGTSLQVVQLQMRLSGIFQRDIPVAALFQHNTIAAQAKLVCSMENHHSPVRDHFISRRNGIDKIARRRRGN